MTEAVEDVAVVAGPQSLAVVTTTREAGLEDVGSMTLTLYG